jgi:hypothetical protein
MGAQVTRARLRLAGAMLLAAVSAACQTELRLVEDGLPKARIVVSPAASGLEAQAASELQLYVKKISGATLPIVTSVEPHEVGVLVRVGVHGGEAVKGWSGQKPAPDGFALETRGPTLFVVGGDARGTLYGAYELLEELGVRWFMPGDLGEDVPEETTLRLPTLQTHQSPAFQSVSGFTWASYTKSAQAWELHMKARVGPAVSFGHNWSSILPLTKENLAKYPEAFAEVNGVRGKSSQLCSAHPDVVRLTVEAARAYFARNPSAPLFSISPNDGYGFCEDSRCRAVDARYGITDGTLSDRLVDYANEVLAELTKTHPDKQVGILAYVQHTRPPHVARPHPNYATLLTHMPWEFCHVHAINDPACPANRRFAEYLEGWSAVARHVGVYDYYGHFFVAAPWPIVHSIRKDLPYLQSRGVERFISETQQHWATQGLNFYVAAQLAWDPRQDVDALLKDYYTRFYGKAAEPMRRYWERWEQAMIATAAEGDGGYEWLRMFTPALVAECGRYLAEAEALAAGDRDKVVRRVAFARTGFGFTDAYTRMIDAGLRGDPSGARAAGEDAIRRLQATANSEPQAFFVSLALDETRYLLGLLERGQIPWVALRP